MKKLIATGLLTVALLGPVSVSAQTMTNEQLQTILNSLLAQVQVLLARLAELQAEQASTTSTLNTVVQHNFGYSVPAPVETPTLSPAQLLTKQVEEKFASKAAYCPRISWGDTISQIKPWFDAPERTAGERDGVYGIWDKVDGYITSSYLKGLKGEPVSNVDYLCGDKVGCNKVLEIQKPYVACMLSQ